MGSREGLEKAFRELVDILGEDRVSRRPEVRFSYSRNWNPCTKDFAALPDIVVLPKSTEEVSEVVKVAYKYRIPVVPRGGGTSMSGGSLARGGILVDTKLMDKVLEVDEENYVVRVQAGIPILKLNEELRKYGLWFPYDVESKAVATVGSIIALRSDGTFNIRYGKIENHVCSITVVTGTGEVVELGHRKTLISSSGYHLHWLFISSEGTLGIITEAVLRVVPVPPHRDIVGFFFPSFNNGVKALVDMLKRGVLPESANLQCKNRLRFYTHAYKAKYGVEPKVPEWTEAVLFLSFAGDADVVDFMINRSKKIAKEYGGEPIDDREVLEMWWTSKHVAIEPEEMRFSWEKPFIPFKQKWPDSQREKRFGAAGVSVPVGKIQEMYKKYLEYASKHGLQVLGMNVYFQHPNSTHVSISFAVWVGDSEDEVKRFYEYVKDMAKTAVELGGSMSAYYGDGEVLAGLNRYEHGKALDYMLKIKQIFDPAGIMNPGKKFGESRWVK
ncbi:MAG: hypothetical protein DRN04_08685 [Thermoprotei archaeon]|nr:MAG: hypothetical protein DRN04_08685 [Thermoprotei archaeon]